MNLNKIKSIYNKGLLIIGLLVVTTGCSDELDLEPKNNWTGDSFYQTENDINAALAGIHSHLSSGNVFGGVIQQMNSGTDEQYKLKSWNENYPTGIYKHNAASVEVRNLYGTLYGGINNANNMIKYIDPTKFEDEAVYNNYLAEARFLRGLMYYHLTIWFNEVPLRLEPSEDQSSNHVAPSPVKEIYEQILADLTFAAENLYSVSEGEYVPGHANSGAAHAMLAKTYLKAAGYPLQASEINGKDPYLAAKEHCSIIMESGDHMLNPSYKDVFLNYIQNRFDLSETLFEMVYRNATDLGLNIAGRIGSYNGLFYGINGSRVNEPVSSPEITPSPLHELLYEDNDSLRKHWNVPAYGANKNRWNPNGVVAEKNPLDWGYTIGKFRRWDAAHPWDLDATNAALKPVVTIEAPEPVNQHFTGINFPLLRFSDVLLMFAEAENQINGPTGEAVSAIDLVRARAGLEGLATVKPEAIAGADAFFDEIVDERFRELCFEGHRKHDLIRWGLLEEKLKEGYEAIIYEPGYNASHAFRHRDYDNFNPSIHLSLPYPEQEVLINNLLEQKTGW
ncbi:RagB/SusD family nutrient uptake outer membrane protein [Urechidicola vernalis]|uniref:RagB/SusD family nutrient uptake outer membrane protein n=1 Tax=Urechidicola vernalis TaxID=3075600 RepID=A0ABU2Y230_9FLAO|nr:RagB/SusD family nutrient uptake outer membrane protein [Urechidicola sp. P050]MDT0551835.1 RagB/SusD family nutrient uptake outer membrane protein [Urechidicola sp. P050]